MTNYVKFPKLIDVYNEIREKNYAPLILILYDKKKNPLDYNNQGLNYIHMIILQGNTDLYKKLTEKFISLKKLKTQDGLTNLLVASLQLNLKILKIVSWDDDNNFNNKDNNILSLTVNFIQKNNLLGLFYLNHVKNIKKSILKEKKENNHLMIQNNEEIIIEDSIFNSEIKDKNNCNFFQWASFLDCIFLVKLFYRFGIKMDDKDNFGDSVIKKALKNNSIHTLIFLLKEKIYPKRFMFYLKNKKKNYSNNFNLLNNIDEKDKKLTKSIYIKDLLEKAIDIENGTYDYFYNFIKKKGISKFHHFIKYWYKVNNSIYNYGKTLLLLWMDFLYLYLIVKFFFNSNTFYFYWSIFIFIFFNFIVLIILNKLLFNNFIYKKWKDYQISNNFKIKEELCFMTKSMEKSNYFIKHFLYRNYLKSQKLNEYFENDIINKFNNEEYSELYEINFENYCPLCLIKKPERTKHISKIGLCIKNFWYYSNFFDLLITNNNIKLYCSFLIVLLIYFVFFIIGLCKNIDIKFNTKFWILFEIFLNLKFFDNMLLFLNYIIIILILKKLLLILYCILNDYTIDEIRNPHKYNYLFKKIFTNSLENDGVLQKPIYVFNDKKKKYLFNLWKFLIN